MSRPLRIGVSACLLHEDKSRPIFNGKPLLYLERSLGAWVASQGALAYLVPAPGEGGGGADAYAQDLDALVLAGGVDVSPGAYGEDPIKPEWSGDAVRDGYEMALARAFIALRKPVLGICRGHQVLNVALGGSLYQDIGQLIDGALVHRRADIYDKNAHDIVIDAGSFLSRLTGRVGRHKVNSVHHQAIKSLGEGLVVDARCEPDGDIEAVHHPGYEFVDGVQWHPEFTDPTDASFLDNAPILAALQRAALASRTTT
ncbi:MAG: gamma-glutamyl-gamma-aminobutyrate hydrolase family protein [Polyangiaceae bacterium]|nr:gamma-glutamyl-gamma-aminobutyrate hydrolase family protein [Polyangiaceae bacterium]